MLQRSYLPDSNRLSVLTAVILLAYALARIIDFQPFEINANLFGVQLAFSIYASSVVSFLAAGLTATGMDWLLRSHPLFTEKNTLEHWILPALTGWVLGISVYSLGGNPFWWLGILLSGVLLVFVCIAEYIAVDSSDVRYGFATAALTAISFVLLLILTVSLHAVGARLFILLPVVFLATGLVSLRAIHLQLGGRWEAYWAFGIALMVSQITAALHYWPLASIQFGLAILGPAYAFTTLAINLNEHFSIRRAIVEPGIILVIVWGLAALR